MFVQAMYCETKNRALPELIDMSAPEFEDEQLEPGTASGPL